MVEVDQARDAHVTRRDGIKNNIEPHLALSYYEGSPMLSRLWR